MVLVTASGQTLYSLSVEKNGKFVCTKRSECLGVWHPLLVPKHGTVKGPVKLGTVKRPEGGSQVTYKGRRQETGGSPRGGAQGRRHLARGPGSDAE